MKKFVISILGRIGALFFHLKGNKVHLTRTLIFRSSARIARSNRLLAGNSSISQTSIYIDGKDNILELKSSYLSDSAIEVIGSNNHILIEEGAKIRKAWIQVRGTGNSIRIEKRSSAGGVRIVNCGYENSIEIGPDCMIADQVEIWSSDTHSISDSEGKLLNPDKPVKIGPHVWLGSQVKVLKGVTIGSGSVVGLSSLVTADIPDNCLAAGSPAKVIKENINWTITDPFEFERNK